MVNAAVAPRIARDIVARFRMLTSSHALEYPSAVAVSGATAPSEFRGFPRCTEAHARARISLPKAPRNPQSVRRPRTRLRQISPGLGRRGRVNLPLVLTLRPLAGFTHAPSGLSRARRRADFSTGSVQLSTAIDGS